MARPQRAGVRALTDEERATLTRVSQAGSERADRVRRATALLAVAQGQPFARAARQAGFRSGTAVADLVGRCNRRGLAALGLAPGRGRKVTYDTAARARIVATAQRAPDREQDGPATWSRSLAAGGRHDDPPGVARGGQFVSAAAHLVPNGDRLAPAQERGGAGGRSTPRATKLPQFRPK